MLIRKQRDRYDGSLKMVRYETTEDGKCVHSLQKSQFDDDIDLFFEQRHDDVQKAEAKVLAGEISPLSPYMDYHSMTVTDVATRMRLSKAAVKKHLTPQGFMEMKVKTLRDYARIFDVAVCEFLQFIHVDDPVSVKSTTHQDRLIQRLDLDVE